MTDILAFDTYKTNAELILAAHRLGYIPDHDGALVLDPTHNRGTFWNIFRPANLWAHDINPEYAPDGVMDFLNLEYEDESFDCVVFDPDYKLEGTSHEPEFADRYGLGGKVRWQDRMQKCKDGVAECGRVVKPGGWLLVKCMNQVCSGKMRWQTIEFGAVAENMGFRRVAEMHKLTNPRPQGGLQKHPRNNYSTLVVLRKEG